jgi:transcriptional regulator with XRE-family HTH domain
VEILQVDSTTELGKNFGNNLKVLRASQHMSQVDLAKRAGLAQSLISQLEKHEGRVPNLKTICKLSEALNVPVSLLVSEDLSKGQSKATLDCITELCRQMPQDTQLVVLDLVRTLHRKIV